MVRCDYRGQQESKGEIVAETLTPTLSQMERETEPLRLPPRALILNSMATRTY